MEKEFKDNYSSIVLVGDSHTWGQGAEEQTIFFPPIQAGDLRPIPFHVPSFANLLRKQLNELTGSECFEISALQGGNANINGIINLQAMLCLQKGYMKMNIKGSFLRLFFKCGRDGTVGRIEIDGDKAGVIDTYDTDNGINNYKMITFDGLEDTFHEVGIFLEEPMGNNTGNKVLGFVKFYRMEAYSGPSRIINSGVGSCDSGKYLQEYWESQVLRYKPRIVVVEAFSINDWLQNVQVDKYKENLEMMINSIHNNGAEAILVTVSPIMGSQENLSGIRYEEYIDASRQIAEKMKVKVADANRRMKEVIKRSKDEKGLFSDNWHVNEAGYILYYQCIAEEMGLL